MINGSQTVFKAIEVIVEQFLSECPGGRITAPGFATIFLPGTQQQSLPFLAQIILTVGIGTCVPIMLATSFAQNPALLTMISHSKTSSQAVSRQWPEGSRLILSIWVLRRILPPYLRAPAASPMVTE
jgi:hypothetical protein